MRRALLATIALASALPAAAQDIPWRGPSVDFSHGPLRVSESRRTLEHADGTPFLWIGDTAWELFHRLTREEAERYLEQRRRQGFTVIQAVALAELEGLDVPNAYGERPLVDNDPANPNEAYFAHVDWIVRAARDKGLVIGLLPTWGDKVVTESWGKGPVVFRPEQPDVARAYGRFLGARYRESPNIIWILGGDRKGGGFEAVWRAMAAGLAEGDGGAHLMTFHPQGGHSSSEWFHEDDWLDFNMLQSGHSARDLDNAAMIARDWARTPVKPVLDGEPRYENHPIDWNPEKGWFDDHDVRQAAYWSILAGGFGVTYGCHDVWQMHAPGRTPISSARNYWYDVLNLPGAWDMLHLRRLLQSRPQDRREPDQALIEGGAGRGGETKRAARGRDYAFAYLPAGGPVTVRLGRFSGEEVRAWWFNPRSGQVTLIGTFPNRSTRVFTPDERPGLYRDWVLVLDDAGKEFGAPGLRTGSAP